MSASRRSASPFIAASVWSGCSTTTPGAMAEIPSAPWPARLRRQPLPRLAAQPATRRTSAGVKPYGDSARCRHR